MTGRRILILGGTGMLGHTLFTCLSKHRDFDVHATARSLEPLEGRLTPETGAKVRGGVDADNFDSIVHAMAEIRPDVVINCIGIIKQLPVAKDPVVCISINALFPHRLTLLCKAAGARLIHISTDCVFRGDKGDYREEDPSDADDLYGRSKFLGEVGSPHCVTLRTSIIGHELKGGYGLVDWFLAQEGRVRGFTNAIYTGFPTVEMSRIIAEHVIPRPELAGLYHVSSDPISKYELLRLVAARYGKDIEIEPYGDFVCNRAMDSTRFRSAAAYTPPSWPEMVEAMWRDYQGRCAGSGCGDGN